MAKLCCETRRTVLSFAWCCFIPLLLNLPAISSTSRSSFDARIHPKAKVNNQRLDNGEIHVNLERYTHELTQKDADILRKAAEFAIENYNSLNRKNKVRRILGVEKETRSNKKFYKLHLLYQEERGALKDRYFIVQAHLNPLGEVAFKMASQRITDKRSRISENSCNKFSKEANCSKCGFHGICAPGSARISPWLEFALRTQRELQIDQPINRAQTLGAHNAFNNRASGYGDLDDCHWPGKENDVCIALANQEFSFTDQLNMGIRNFEIDLWNCFGKIRMSHGNEKLQLGCFPWDEELADGIKEFSDWIRTPRNRKEIIQLFFDDHTSGDDDLINGVIEKYFGDSVLTPRDLKTSLAGRWPTTREMRRVNKSVILLDGANNHKGCYIHGNTWSEGFTVRGFSSHLKNCSTGDTDDIIRVYSDSTRYGPLWNGIKEAGTILDFKKFLLCGVTIPCADQVNPELMKTAVFTWAEGEPRQALTEASCVVVARDGRWHTANCTEKHHFACVSNDNRNRWNLSRDSDEYLSPSCRDGQRFSVPQNGYQHKQLVDASKGKTIWINLTPFISLLKR